MKLNGRQTERLSDALRDAFTPQALARLLSYKLSLRLSDFSSFGNGGNAQEIVFDLLLAANADEWVDRLLLAAREAAPGNAALYAVAQQFGLTATRATRQELERVIVESNQMQDPDLFRARLGALEPKICRIEYTKGGRSVFGTGFLVAPDVIMTNHHVIAPLLAPAANVATQAAPAAAVRFDYRHVYDALGTLVRTNEGRVCRFAADWLVDGSPAPDGHLPPAAALDYALVRVREAAGDDILDGGANPAAPARRGFIDLPAATPDFAPGSSLFILQHPSAQPLKVALDTKSVLGLFDAGARVRYTTNTEPGSSGSPCFSPSWDLMALHHSGDPNFDPEHHPGYNQGIPIHLIRGLIQQRGKGAALGAAKD